MGVVATLKKWVTHLDQVRIELKIGPTDPCGDFIDIFGAELGFFGKTDHRVPFDLQNAAGRFLSITEWMAKKAPEILHELVSACSHTDSHTELGLYKGYLKLYSCLMTEDDLYQLLLTRLRLQGIEATDLPLFLRDLAAIHKSKPESDVAAVNARLSVLGWHQVQLDYQSLQLALAWMETEARNSNT